MDESVESEIEKILQEIERLKKDGAASEDRISDLNAYLRVLHARLTIALQNDPGRWG
jgi:hypothetical protein